MDNSEPHNAQSHQKHSFQETLVLLRRHYRFSFAQAIFIIIIHLNIIFYYMLVYIEKMQGALHLVYSVLNAAAIKATYPVFAAKMHH